MLSGTQNSLPLACSKSFLWRTLNTMYVSHRIRFASEMGLFVFLTFCFTSFHRQRHINNVHHSLRSRITQRNEIQKEETNSPKPRNWYALLHDAHGFVCTQTFFCVCVSVFVIKWEIWEKKPFFVHRFVFCSKWISLAMPVLIHSLIVLSLFKWKTCNYWVFRLCLSWQRHRSRCWERQLIAYSYFYFFFSFCLNRVG